jgi:iron complex transport system permease protein
VATAGITLVAVCVAALWVGRYPVPVSHVFEALTSGVFSADGIPDQERTVIVLVRLPRVLLAALVGGGLGLAGAALQATFRNPLVSPEIIGVSSGASLGGSIALLLGLGSAYLVGGAFIFGLTALALLFVLTRGRAGTPMLMVVLGGVVVGSFFSALVALATYVADPYTTLPAIVFWLLGSLATATATKVAVAAGPILLGTTVILLLRWRLNVLSLGDEEAASLGMKPGRMRWTVLVATALIVAGGVAVSGVIGWVGLIIPHLARMWVGPDHRVLLPVSFLAGAAYLVLIDTIARTLTAGEVPLGVLTAVVGAPAFFVLLRHNRDRVWEHA